MQFENHLYYNCEITLANDEKYWVDANYIHNSQFDQWKGWSCNAGFRRLSIDKDFNVYSGECHNDYLGNLKTKWAPLDEPTTCKQQRCTGCTDDLLISKQAPLGVNNA